ncbi:MAG: helix-turn-helix domain-containing protein [Solirubrobacteraceae bacterium]|jgi:transcriptional regulator with XRE-family HTH domain
MDRSAPGAVEAEASAAIALLPPARLGFLLRARREQAGLGVPAAARAAGIPAAAVDDIEAGRAPATVGVLAAMLRFYEVPLGAFVPPRRPLVVANADATSDEVLRGYIGAVRTWRKAGHTDKLNLRRSDVATLATLLGTEPHEIERRLISITGCSKTEARLLRKWFLAALISMPLAYGAVAGLVPAAAAALATSNAPPAASAPDSQLTVTFGHAGGVMRPGAGRSQLPYTISNPGGSAQRLARTTARVASADGDITEHGAPVSGCEAQWFVASDRPAQDDATIHGHASVRGVVDVTMRNVDANQDACEGATPDVVVDAG